QISSIAATCKDKELQKRCAEAMKDSGAKGEDDEGKRAYMDSDGYAWASFTNRFEFDPVGHRRSKFGKNNYDLNCTLGFKRHFGDVMDGLSCTG
ncbi:hypothetical protein PMAYCL1PPCAC_22484, partial [Pristionchus mayeri]